MSDFKFSYNYVRMAPRKVRLVTNLVKKMPLDEALLQLKFLQKAAAKPVYELLKSAQATFKNKNIETGELTIKSITCNQGSTLKRRTYRSRGRASMIKKRTSHINLIVSLPEKSNKKANKKKDK